MISLSSQVVSFAFTVPLRISRGVETAAHCVHVTLTDEHGHSGRGEALGVNYSGETPETMLAQVHAVSQAVQRGLTREQLALLLPAGGARNAIDCAMWDLQAKQTGVPAWQRAGLKSLKPIETAYTFGIMEEAELRRMAATRSKLTTIKIKTDGLRGLAPVRVLHEALPHARIIIDPNQGWTPELLHRFNPDFRALNVALLEQPLPVDGDEALAGMKLSVPVAADESFTDAASIAALAKRYQVLNIKLDKTGGLTEALIAAHTGLRAGLRLMVGCMAGSSLSMAPAALVAQLCDFCDLDGPLLHSTDVPHALVYEGSTMSPPTPALWG
jgi:L-Ala-D/L-Glu epimerase